MAIDDNSWDAGYEFGMRDEKRESAKVILALEQQIGVLQALLASRCKVAGEEVSDKMRQAEMLIGPRISV